MKNMGQFGAQTPSISADPSQLAQNSHLGKGNKKNLPSQYAFTGQPLTYLW